MRKHIFCICLCFLLTSSCEYEPKGEHYIVVDPAIPELANLQLNFTDSVLYLENDEGFIYDIRFLDQQVYQVEFYLDERKIETLYRARDEVIISAPEGTHILKMRIYSSTESGSLADIVGAEAFIYEKEWVLKVDRTGKYPIQVTLKEEEGSLVLTWTEKSGIDFHSYVIFRKRNNHFLPIDTIWDPAVISYIDKDILGGENSYYISLHRNHLPDVDGINAIYPPITYEMRIDVEKGVQATISWNPCVFHNNFDRYNLWQSVNGAEMTIIYTSTQVEDTIYTLPLTENQQLRFKVEYVAITDNTYNIELSDELYYFYEPESIPDYTTLSQSVFEPYNVVSSSFYYDAEADWIKPLQIPESEMLMLCSPDNRFILSGKTMWEYVDNAYEVHHSLPLLPEKYLFCNELTASMSLEAAIGYFELEGEAVIYDMQNDSLLNTFTDFVFRRGLLSPDGSIFSSRMTHNETTLAFYHTPACENIVRHCPDSESDPVYISHREFYVKRSGRLERWFYKDLAEHSWEKYYYPAFSGDLLAYDPLSVTVLTYLNGNLQVHKASDMSIIVNRYIGNNYSLESGHFAYLNKKVFLRESNGRSAVMIKLFE